MDDNKKNTEQTNDIYDQFAGYFPKEYDLSPEKLEEDIVLESKKSEIAIGMASVSKPAIEIRPEPAIDPELVPIEEEAAEKVSEDSIEEVSDDAVEDIADLPTVEYSSEEAEDEIINKEADSWVPPAAEDVTENELLNKYEPLDELLSELEDMGNDEDEKPAKKEGGIRGTLSWLFDFLEVFSVCMLCIIVIFSFFARLTKVDGESMEDTLYDGQYLIVSDFLYTPKNGDIVVFQDMKAEDPRLREPLVKRVIAVGGETIDVALDGTVTVTDKNGVDRVIVEDYIKDEQYMRGACTVAVPEGYVFVMGDNRNNSSDSRDSRLGLVDERCIFGRAVVRILPVTEFTFFKNPNK